jgi:peptide deformylase
MLARRGSVTIAVLPIPQIGDPVLRWPTADVSQDDLATDAFQSLIDDMIETMREANGAGIAATQVGVSHNMCIIGGDANRRYPYKPRIPLTVLINPVIQALDGVTYLNNEGCLSVPLRGDLSRFMNIEVSHLDRDGSPVTTRYGGLSAGTVQHEVDHLAGILIVDRMHDSRTMSTWDNFSKHHMADYIDRIQPVINQTKP